MATPEVEPRAGNAAGEPPEAGALEFGIVNYNGGDALLRCVRSILSQDGPVAGVWVFDNASADGSADAVAAAHPEVRVVRAPENLGYAGALNGLLERMTAEVAVLCNMDLTFDPGWAAAVAGRFADGAELAALSTPVLEDTDPPVVNSVGVRFYGDLHAQNVGSGEPYRPGALEGWAAGAFGCYGAVMALRRERAAALSFDADYFLFFEETDFFLRLALTGGEMGFEPGAIARHQRSMTTRRYSPLKLYYGERNRLTTVFKLLPAWYWPVAMVHTLRRLAALAGQRGEGGEEGGGAGRGREEARAAMPSTLTILRTLVRAWTGALVRLPGTLRKRRAFWKQAPGRPREALRLLRRYRLPTRELRLR